MQKIENIAKEFAIEGTVIKAEAWGTGLINDTYKITTQENSAPNYVVQRINNAIFTDVDLLQNNVRYITEHVRQKLIARKDSDINRKTLTIVLSKNGDLYYVDGNSYWRMMTFIENSISYEQVSPKLAYYTGKGFGEFQYFLSDTPEGSIKETITNFHNMEFRLEQLQDAITHNSAGRLDTMKDIVNELTNRADDMCLAQRLFRQGKFPKRITHCDTKVNNMLFDENDNFLCVIDLDTTMPGFVLSDFGDFIRTAANTGSEDDSQLNNVGIDMNIFRSFAQGYIESAKSFLSTTEIENLAYGAQLMTYMQTVRFLTDYINGDTYYKVKHPEHNKQRTLAQLTHLHSIDAHINEMNEFIATLIK